MSTPDAKSFWASKSSNIMSTTSPTPTFTEPPPKQVAPPPKKGFVLNRTMSSTTDSGRGRANWADDEDDDEVLAKFAPDKSAEVLALQDKLAYKKSQVEEMEQVVEEKEMRIAQLEGAAYEKDAHIANLEAEADAHKADVERMANDNQNQQLYIQEMVAEIGGKDRRIAALEAERDNLSAHMCIIPEVNSSSPTTVLTDTSDTSEPEIVEPEVAEPEATQPEVTKPVETAHEHVAPQETVAPAEKTEGAGETAKTEPAAEDEVTQPVDAAKKAGAEPAGPAANDSKFPKLWCPEVAKKVVPPVEKPKILKMAIDMSKFGKKREVPVAPVPVKRKTSESSYGHNSKNRAKTSTVPTIDPTVDIRHMAHAERVLFANGPVVDVLLGDTKLATLPKYILMQCSTKAYKHFNDNVDATSITFPEGSMEAEFAKLHLSWMDEMTYQGRVYSVTLNAELDARNIKICQASRAMGLNNTYVGHFTKILCDKIRTNTTSLEFMSMICEVANAENDPVFECLVNNLANQQMNKTTAREPEELEVLLEKFPLFKEKMEVITHRVKNSRAGDRRKGRVTRGPSHDHNGDPARSSGRTSPVDN